MSADNNWRCERELWFDSNCWAVIHRSFITFSFLLAASLREVKKKPTKKKLMKSSDLCEMISVSIEISNHQQEKIYFSSTWKILNKHQFFISILSSEEEGKFNEISFLKSQFNASKFAKIELESTSSHRLEGWLSELETAEHNKITINQISKWRVVLIEAHSKTSFHSTSTEILKKIISSILLTLFDLQDIFFSCSFCRESNATKCLFMN